MVVNGGSQAFRIAPHCTWHDGCYLLLMQFEKFAPMGKTLTVLFLAMAGGVACSSGGTTTSAAPTTPGVVNTDAGASPFAAAMRTFATSSAYSGNLIRFAKPKRLTGPEAADWLCADAAATAGVGGNWRAWISGSDADAVERVKEDGPWVSVNRKYVTFKNRADIGSAANGSFSPVLLENGKPAEGAVSGFVDQWGKPAAATLDNTIYTGSTAGGRTSGATCEDWTSEGQFNPNGTFSYLNTDAGGSNLGCEKPRSLLCLEQKEVVAPAPSRGVMFVTERSYTARFRAYGDGNPAPTGLTGADARCNDEAQAAGLAGAFVALLAVPGKSIADRVEESAFDGWSDATGKKVLFSSKSSLVTARFPVTLSASGTRSPSDEVWTGATPAGTASAYTCAGWTSTSSSDTGTADSFRLTPSWLNGKAPNSCSGDAASLYCAQTQ